jgi:hypothetical protein
MKKRYSHIRMECKREALNALGHIRPAAQERLTNADVLQTLEMGLSEKLIVAKIQAASDCAFDISLDAIKQLTANSVPDAVILAMVRA